jgi:hypothetical protein
MDIGLYFDATNQPDEDSAPAVDIDDPWIVQQC